MNTAEESVRLKYEALGWRLGKPGAPDFIGVDAEGHPVAIEVKAGKDTLSDEQWFWRRVLEAAGIHYILEELPERGSSLRSPESMWTSLGVRESTRDKLREMKRNSNVSGISDDAFLSVLLDSFNPDMTLHEVAQRRRVTA